MPQQHTAAAAATAGEVLALPQVFGLVEAADLPARAVSVCEAGSVHTRAPAAACVGACPGRRQLTAAPLSQVALRLPALYEEAALLQRLAYKNTNQHRVAKHHQAVCQVRVGAGWPGAAAAPHPHPKLLTHVCNTHSQQVLRVLKLFKQQQLPEQLAALHAAAQRTSLPEAPAASKARRAKRHQPGPPSAAAGDQQRQAVRLPSAQAGCTVLRRLLSSAQLLLDLQRAVLAAGQHLSGQLSRGYFMPYCVVAAAAVARIRVLAAAGLLELLQAYNSVVALLPLLPVAGNSSAEDSCEQLHGISSMMGEASALPQVLQLSWAGPIPALRRLPFEASGPQSFLGQAAELQQTYCISRPGRQAGGAEQTDWQQQGEAGEGVGDLGVAIPRDSFQQQQEQVRRHGKVLCAQQQRPGVFEDKQPVLMACAQQQQQQQVPAYRTVPGLGFATDGCDTTTRAQQVGRLQPAPLPPAAHVAGAAPGVAGAAAAAVGGDAMDVDSGAVAADAAAYQELFGSSVQQPAAAPAQQQQLAAPVGAKRPVLQVSAALLAMQGGGGSSSDDDDAAPVAAAPGARAAFNVSAVPSAQLQQHQQPAAAAPGAGPAGQVQVAAPPAAAAAPPAATAAPTAAAATAPALLVAKRRQKRKQQQPRTEDAPPPPRDSILDMLLQGL
jgi:hypothetical protein